LFLNKTVIINYGMNKNDISLVNLLREYQHNIRMQWNSL